MAQDSAAPADVLERRPLLIGMVHVGPTPGSPGEDGSSAWLDDAVEDAEVLAEAGFDAVLVENFGDAPFYPRRVPAETVAALTLAAAHVADCVPPTVGVGINVLRNDAESALAIAAVVGLDFIRVNVLAGAAVTDQGLIEGRAAEVQRLRARLAPGVRVFADVRVKHARPLVERPLEEEVRELVGRAGADAVIVSGAATGAPVDAGELAVVRTALGLRPLLVGSGADAANVRALLERADGVIVGTAIKTGRITPAQVDPDRAKAFVEAARG